MLIPSWCYQQIVQHRYPLYLMVLGNLHGNWNNNYLQQYAILALYTSYFGEVTEMCVKSSVVYSHFHSYPPPPFFT